MGHREDLEGGEIEGAKTEIDRCQYVPILPPDYRGNSRKFLLRLTEIR